MVMVGDYGLVDGRYGYRYLKDLATSQGVFDFFKIKRLIYFVQLRTKFLVHFQHTKCAPVAFK